ncbi:MAG TPA: hypothetical protein VKA18_12285 [Alphaproteobacteria bacterium]|nr:hypothetical protein [Alphaproteobacteria bacterium]
MARQRRVDPSSGFTRESLETLLDLVEIRLGHVEIYDREDARELRMLEQTRDQLVNLLDPEPAREFQQRVASGPRMRDT